MSTNSNIVRIGHSPDPDDAFMFYGFASGQVSIPGYQIRHVMKDIQTLNEVAKGNEQLEVTAMSLHAFFELEDHYEFLEVGTSVGRRYGPRVISAQQMSLAALEGKRVALPGEKTTATLVARRLLPPIEEAHMDFKDIMGAVRSGDVVAGVVIHEGQLTYADEGFHLLADLGELFADKHDGLPLPLGVNCVRSDLDANLKQHIADAYRASVNIALTQRKAAIEYSLAFARGLDRDLADTFVGMYVNEDSLAFNDEMRQAVKILREEYWQHANVSNAGT